MSRAFITVIPILVLSLAAAGVAAAEDGGGNGGGGKNPGTPALTGTVDKLPASGLTGVWSVAGQSVTVAGATKIVQTSGPLALGSCVQVFSASPPATPGFTATEIDIISATGGCSLAPANQHSDFEFFGAVTTLPATPAGPGDWTIATRLVHSAVTTTLDIEGAAAVGVCAEVKGSILPDGSIQASRIKTDLDKSTCTAGSSNAPPMRFVGTVSALPSASTPIGKWTVSGTSVLVAASTEIEPERGPIATGSCVSVRGAVQADSSITATSIESEDAAQCSVAAGTAGTFDLEAIVITPPPGGTTGDWIVGKLTVRVSVTTTIDTSHGAIQAGACVEARGTLAPDGVLLATLLEATSSSGTCLLHDGIVSAGSYLGGGVAPGQIISIFGLNIGTAAPHDLDLDGDHVTNNLASVRVFFDGIAAPLLLVSPGQVNAVVPFEVAGKSSTQVQLQNNDAWSNALTIPVNAAIPALFTLTQDGKGQGAVQNFDDDSQQLILNGALGGASGAAKKGSVIVLYLTGTGQYDIAESDGVLAGSQLAHVLGTVTVSIGGKDAKVLYAGSAPTLVAGVSQINVRVPDDSPDGPAVPIVVSVGEGHSPDGVTVSIR